MGDSLAQSGDQHLGIFAAAAADTVVVADAAAVGAGASVLHAAH